MESIEDPQALYFRLLKQCIRANSKRNLSIINDICEEQVRRGSSDFSIATISRISDKHNGPKESSIRNKAGEKYRALISSYQRVYCKKNDTKSTPQKYDWIEQIEQPDIRWLIKDLVSENKKLKGEINTLKSINTLQIDLSNSDCTEKGGPLTPLEEESLRDFISTSRLNGNGWEFDRDGRLVEKTSQLALSAVALKSALNKLNQTNSQ